ncbi:MAG: Hpt domain-containing protein [Chitinophagales bacterium]|nr:Hpt domain-containing protein [Chitinophagales bacterium]MDW8427359.1 Hpt domain-containing protein [Chitinophagales bacterium]
MHLNTTGQHKVERRYDLKFLYDYYGEQTAALREVLQLFLQETPELLQEIGAHLTSGRVELARSATHKIKTNLAMLGIADPAGFVDHMHQLKDRRALPGETMLLYNIFRREVEMALQQIREDFFNT